MDLKPTKIFFDTEFTGLHKNTTLISIGFVSECGKTFYAEFTDYDKTQVNDWIQNNVINNLVNDLMLNNSYETTGDHIRAKGDKNHVQTYLKLWFSKFQRVELWSDVLAYDWVLFCDLFGSAFDIPENIHYIPRDLATLLDTVGVNPDINREEFAGTNAELETLEVNALGYWGAKPNKHNSLWDAYIIRECYKKALPQNLPA